MFMDKLDRWTKLLGTVLVKVSFVDPETGHLVKETEGGQVQLDMLHGGVYDIRHGASPYYITELLIGFGTKFNGFKDMGPGAITGVSGAGGGVASTVPSPSKLGQADIEARQGSPSGDRSIQQVNRIYWNPNVHKVYGEDNKQQESENPYGIIPAVPFFNTDPAHYYFLPINEPLIYANHAINMRISDLNHIAKFQSFGVPVVSGIERPTSLRQGRPVDDFNILKGGAAQSRFGGIGGITAHAAGGAFRTYDAGMGIFKDGNADAAALGISLGPDSAIAVGEKGDFKFAQPSADITGLLKTIESIADMVRINHGLKPKHKENLPSSGFSLLLQKMGVIEENIRRSKLFKEREQQLFQIIKRLWNTHNRKNGDKKFSEDATLEITYKTPDFPVDPKTKMEVVSMESKIIESGNRKAIKELYPHLSDIEINKLVKQYRKDKTERELFETELQVQKAKLLEKENIVSVTSDSSLGTGRITRTSSGSTIQMQDNQQQEEKIKNSIDNKAKHSEDSSKQKNRNGDFRGNKEIGEDNK